MNVWFKRTDKMHEEMRKITIPLLDSPRYQYFFGSDWMGYPEEFKDMGWHKDVMLIMAKIGTHETAQAEIAGYISWQYNRTHEVANSVIIILKPEFINKGVGVKALAKWLFYAMNRRRFRKVEFSCHVKNEGALRLYSQIKDIGGREVGVKKQADKLRDGLYHDRVLFEIMRENFKPTELFMKFVGDGVDIR